MDIEGQVNRMRLIDADALIAWTNNYHYAEKFTVAHFANMVKDSPTIKPERNYDEWCLDCKEYDHDRHCCPRFNRVIGSVMDEIKTDKKLAKLMKIKGRQ